MSLPAVKDPSELPDIIRRYAAGESMATLGKEYKVSRATIYLWMLGGMEKEEHEHVVTQCLVNRIAEGDEELDTAETAFDIARAREKARYSRMDFERRRPHLYGPKQEVKHTGQLPSLVINVVPPQQMGVVHDVPISKPLIEHKD